jgi:hypothetical protein
VCDCVTDRVDGGVGGFGFGFGDKSFMKTSPKNIIKRRFPKIKILKCLAL